MRKDKSKLRISLEKWCIKNLYEILLEKEKQEVLTEKQRAEQEASIYILQRIKDALGK